jgi:hypothetical protein
VKIKTFLWASLAMSVAGVFAQSTSKPVSSGGKLEGHVIDAVEKTALTGVSVKMKRSETSKPEEKITEPDGTFAFSGLVPGRQYELTYSRFDYVPETRKVTVPTKADQELLKQRASVTYWKKQAAIIRTSAANNGGTSQAFEKEWESFRKRPVSAEGKAVVAQELQGTIGKSLLDSHSFVVYANADPRKLSEIERALAKNPNDTSASALDPVLVQDIRAATPVKFMGSGGRSDEISAGP